MRGTQMATVVPSDDPELDVQQYRRLTTVLLIAAVLVHSISVATVYVCAGLTLAACVWLLGLLVGLATLAAGVAIVKTNIARLQLVIERAAAGGEPYEPDDGLQPQ
jgi:hypothetical protein